MIVIEEQTSKVSSMRAHTTGIVNSSQLRGSIGNAKGTSMAKLLYEAMGCWQEGRRNCAEEKGYLVI